MAFVGLVALLLLLLRYFSSRLVLSASASVEREVSMKETLTAGFRLFFSSMLETIWAIGTSSVASCLSA